MEATTLLLKREEVSEEEFEAILTQLKSEQLLVKLRRGKVTYDLGIMVEVREGREGLFGKLAFNPGIKFRMKGEGEAIRGLYVEWVTRGI